MQALNLQAPKTAQLDVPVKTKGTQVAKKTPAKKTAQTQSSSFKDMVDQSAKQEDELKSKTTQSPTPTQQADSVQEATSKTTPECTNERGRKGEHTDERKMVASAQSSPQASPLELTWLQSALQGENTQEQAASALAQPLGDEAIAFLKADPLLDEGLSVEETQGELAVPEFSATTDDAQMIAYSETDLRQSAGAMVEQRSRESPVQEAEADELLLQEMSTGNSAIAAAHISGKQKDKAQLSQASQQSETTKALTEVALASQDVAAQEASTQEAAVAQETLAAQNELLGGVFTVTDLRPAPQKGERTTEPLADGKAQAQGARTELTAQLTLPQTTHTATPAQLKEAGGVPSFQRLLSEQLRSAAPDFAKAGSIVLRGENEGVIKLSLRPESLGNVKINLQLSDNVVTGKIAVASKEAFEAFKQNIGALRQAFSDSGFEGAEFTLSYFDSSSGFAQESGGQNDGHFLSHRAYADYVSGEDSLSDTADAQLFAFDTDKKVNVVA